MSKVIIKSSGKTEFLYKSFSILVVIVSYLSMSMSVLYAAANINQQPNVTVDATRQDVMNRLANITRTVNNDLPQKIANGLRWTDFGYTQEGDHGVPELIFTYELDMKAIYGPSCPDGQLSEGFLDVFKNNILRSPPGDEKRLPWHFQN